MTMQHIVVAGAGSIGCFVGGHLAHAGHRVTFLGRERIVRELSGHGLTLSDRDGARISIAATGVHATADPDVLALADLILVTVKSGATVEMAHLIAERARPRTRVVSLQNGIENADILRALLPDFDVVQAMVPFNVVALGEGRFHRGTDGDIMIDARATGLAETLSSHHMPVVARADMTEVAWGKLLLNLNNALNALSGIPLREQLALRQWRSILAACIAEALQALEAAGITPAKIGKVAPALLPGLLRLPNFLFGIVAKSQLKIDPSARSSMWDDLQQHRLTEIDQLQGAVVALANQHGRVAKTNQKILDLVKAAEQARVGSPMLRPEQIAPHTV